MTRRSDYLKFVLVFGLCLCVLTLFAAPGQAGKFKKEYPEISITLRIGDTEEIVNELLSSKIEVGIIGAKINNPRLHLIPFIEDELTVVVPRGHRWWQKHSSSRSRIGT